MSQITESTHNVSLFKTNARVTTWYSQNLSPAQTQLAQKVNQLLSAPAFQNELKQILEKSSGKAVSLQVRIENQTLKVKVINEYFSHEFTSNATKTPAVQAQLHAIFVHAQEMNSISAKSDIKAHLNSNRKQVEADAAAYAEAHPKRAPDLHAFDGIDAFNVFNNWAPVKEEPAPIHKPTATKKASTVTSSSAPKAAASLQSTKIPAFSDADFATFYTMVNNEHQQIEDNDLDPRTLFVTKNPEVFPNPFANTSTGTHLHHKRNIATRLEDLLPHSSTKKPHPLAPASLQATESSALKTAVDPIKGLEHIPSLFAATNLEIFAKAPLKTANPSKAPIPSSFETIEDGELEALLATAPHNESEHMAATAASADAFPRDVIRPPSIEIPTHASDNDLPAPAHASDNDLPAPAQTRATPQNSPTSPTKTILRSPVPETITDPLHPLTPGLFRRFNPRQHFVNFEPVDDHLNELEDRADAVAAAAIQPPRQPLLRRIAGALWGMLPSFSAPPRSTEDVAMSPILRDPSLSQDQQPTPFDY